MENENLEDLGMPSDAELGLDIGGGAGVDLPDLEADEGDAGEPDGGRGGRHPSVPLPEVKNLRERLKSSEAEIARLREVEKEKIRFEERINFHRQQQEQERQLEEARKAKEEEERAAAEDGEAPDPDDPAYQDWRYNKLERELQRERQARTEHAQQTEIRQRQELQKRVISSVVQEYTAFENAYALNEETSDYKQAFNHLAGVYANAFRRRGIPEEQLLQHLEAERSKVIKDCLQLNDRTGEYVWVRDPAHVLYQLAQDFGYVPKGRRAAAGDGELSDEEMAAAAAYVTQGEQASRQAPPARKPSPRAETLARSTGAAARSGAQGRTSAAPRIRGPITLAVINSWDEDEFRSMYETHKAEIDAAMAPHG